MYVSDNGSLSGKLDATGNLPGAALKYDMDAGADAWVALNARLSTGSGSGDMALRVPEAQLGGGAYLYLYSKFGAAGGAYAANGGFEEWAVQGPAGGAVTDLAVVTGRLGQLNEGGFIPVVAGTYVYLLDANSVVIDVVQTDINGYFRFNNVALSGTGGSFTLNVGNGTFDPNGHALLGSYSFLLPPPATTTPTYDLGTILF